MEASRSSGVSETGIYSKLNHTKGIDSTTKYLWAREDDVEKVGDIFKIKNFDPPDVYIYQFDFNGNFICKYHNLDEASEKTNVNRVTIWHHLKHKVKRYGKNSALPLENEYRYC